MSSYREPDDGGLARELRRSRPRISDEKRRKLEEYAAEIFTLLGLDLNTEATHETPHRFIQALIDITCGYEGDPKLIKAFNTECRGGSDCRLSQVIEGPINFFSLCEHHALPFFGQAYVGYIAHEHIIGISKLARLIHLFSRRFAVQERIGQRLADSLVAELQPHGVAVYLVARHLCIEMRGVRETAPLTRTTCWRGNYEDDPELRADFWRACRLKK